MPAAKKPTKNVQEKHTSPAMGPAETVGVLGALKAAKVVDKVRKSVTGKAHEASTLFEELEALAQYIQDAKKEIAALNPAEVKEEFLPTAADELDAIIEATADATNAIMDSTEKIEDEISVLDCDSEALMQSTTRIYEACGFQDITGQRISKVVNTLKDIERKVDDLLVVFAEATIAGTEKTSDKPVGEDMKDGSHLLNGPQGNDKAKSQLEIDALLASFD